MAADREPILKPEVLPPTRPSQGLGVLVVAATTMFLAIASSVFVLQARMLGARPYQRQAPVPVHVDERGRQAQDVTCGRVFVMDSSDGRIVVRTPPCSD